ncbi:MAG: hypothetical protein GXP62_03050 [Oligoflexia bacterium]|nr:hypothetical protein [Oligoflexia bacterium]
MFLAAAGLSALLLSGPAARADTDVILEAYGQQLTGDGLGLGLGGRVQATRAAFLSVEGRGTVGGTWLGRGTVGLDLFGGSETIDLTLGLFLGTTGSWDPLLANPVDPTAGFELGLGLNLGPVRGRYRHADGFRGPLEYRLTQNDWRLGYELGRTQFFGQYVRFNPGETRVVGGFGLGMSMTF